MPFLASFHSLSKRPQSSLPLRALKSVRRHTAKSFNSLKRYSDANRLMSVITDRLHITKEPDATDLSLCQMKPHLLETLSCHIILKCLSNKQLLSCVFQRGYLLSERCVSHSRSS
ncbi:uncharacterized protein LOC117106134 isoform X3 [Anneissia japonica]|uniref:uncharacterized protein LOC117106134 isoform X3 n=1 Tax=Anneissia japonica TaxID=1529436 RepID=UPI0014255318|nr:uncharacterized protein LOC117106134 isoform X3 [Anneissia japonica]